MVSATAILFLLLATTAVLVGLLLWRPAMTANRGGKVLAFSALFIFPVLCAVMGATEQLERSKRTEFCLSCHLMQDYGRSLYVDDPGYVAASHFQNNRVPPESACFACHTDYVMYGDLAAKMRGLRHVYVQYLGQPTTPIELYRPYNNRECLYCHAGARSFEENPVHSADRDFLQAMRDNEVSCVACHTPVHNVQGLDEATFWEPGAEIDR